MNGFSQFTQTSLNAFNSLYLEAEKLNPTYLIVPRTKPSREFFGTGFGFGGPLIVKAYSIKIKCTHLKSSSHFCMRIFKSSTA